MSTDLETLAAAVGVLLDPASPEGTGTTLHYLLAALIGLAVSSAELFALLREGGGL